MIKTNLQRAVNININGKNKVHNFMFRDAQQTYRVILMLRDHWKCDVRTAYRRYANFVCAGCC